MRSLFLIPTRRTKNARFTALLRRPSETENLRRLCRLFSTRGKKRLLFNHYFDCLAFLLIQTSKCLLWLVLSFSNSSLGCLLTCSENDVTRKKKKNHFAGRLAFFLFIIYFWLRWVLAAVCVLSLAEASRGYPWIAVLRLLLVVASLVAKHGL